jgi:uncharacterized protein YqgV (UPF0045/DUF77 family)
MDKMESDCNRVSVSIKMDVRKGAKDRLTGKMASVEEKLGRSINK